MQVDKKTGVSYRKWPAASPKAAMLLIHGLGTQSESWEFFASFFLRHNIPSYAIELKGFGQTEGPKGHIESFRTYFDDIRNLRGIIIAENKGAKVFLAGQSFGGLLAFSMALHEPRLFDGLVCIAPAFAPTLKFTIFDYINIISSSFYRPRKCFKMPFTSEMCTRDTDYQIVLDSDPREIRFATAKLLRNTAFAEIRSIIFKNRLKDPALFLVSGKDTLASTAVTRKVFKGLKIKDKEIIEYPGMLHALNVELGREKVFGDILQWVEKRSGKQE